MNLGSLSSISPSAGGGDGITEVERRRSVMFGVNESMTTKSGGYMALSPDLPDDNSIASINTLGSSAAPMLLGNVSNNSNMMARWKRGTLWIQLKEFLDSLPAQLVNAFTLRQPPLLARTILIPAESQTQTFPPNVIRNQKYNLITFLPVVLYEQFKFFFNLYFLLTALSQLIPALKIGYYFTYFAPLAFVLSVTIGKEAYDDYKRYKRDQDANSEQYKRLTPYGLQTLPSSQLRVGDMIMISKDQRVPADCVLLRASDPTGVCFIRTDQLDGETDWKMRLAIPFLQKLPSDESLLEVKATIEAEKPTKDIHTFHGAFSLMNSNIQDAEPLNVEHTLWSNTVLASGTVIGLVVYTGRETRSVMNTSFPGTKVGQLDNEINRLSKILAVVTFLLSLTMVALDGFRGLWYIYVFRYLILFSSIIPISLRVNLDMGKTVYSFQIMNDPNIPDTIVRTSTIPEDLGRIEYLLSDKTGTLTKNEMELRRLHIGTMLFSTESMDDIRLHIASVLNHHEREQDHGRFRRRDLSNRVFDIVWTLALCHNVTPVTANDGSITYQASSPDEIAIVKWTSSAGVTLHQRSSTRMQLHFHPINTLEPQSIHSFQILHTFPFTSERKRMGIIIQEDATGAIWFLCKGADGVMATLVQYNDWLEEECGNMARDGLRTLVIARKKLGDFEYQEFKERYHSAQLSLSDRNERVAAAIGLLEKDLELLGLTGVEDELQDNVKMTLEQLRNAGLKIWMLTGDKVETATCVALNSRLIARNQQIHTVSKVNDAMVALNELDIIREKGDVALILDGESLHTFVTYHAALFASLAIALPVVICCRCSPTQKAEITSLIKTCTGRRVMAVGDGGNDVSMIQAADVGIGIVGKEGQQASLAADFSVTQFKYIPRLLLWHGRNSYKRSAKLSQFVIHRGLIISVMQAVFSAIFYFAPIALYQGLLVVGYATIFTMAPVFSLVLDRDLTEEMAFLYPEMYKELRKGRSLSFKTFFMWLLVSVYQGGAIMILSLVLFENDFVNIVAISFTALIFNELLMVALEITTWHPLMIWSEIGTFFIYIGSMMLLKRDFDLAFIMTFGFVWRVAVITALSSLPLYIFQCIRTIRNPPSYLKLLQ